MADYLDTVEAQLAALTHEGVVDSEGNSFTIDHNLVSRTAAATRRALKSRN